MLDSTSFVDTTWLARGGFLHSEQMRVVEKLTRQGNQIRYEVTVEDPEVLLEQWVMTPKIMRLNPNADAGRLPERGHCEVYELEDITIARIPHAPSLPGLDFRAWPTHVFFRPSSRMQ